MLKDNVEVTKLWVKIDNGSFAQVSGYVGDGASTEYSYALSEGDHTYTFKAQDAAGNESGLSVFHVKLDTVKPEFGPLSYENKAATLWQWVIGRKSLIIRVPVSENGSGVSQIHYTMTPMDAAGNPDSSREEQKSAAIKDGAAEIVFPQDSAYQGFRGQIVINCSDLAGNAADSITVGMEDGASGVIVEDTAPVISVLADREPSDMTAAMQNGTALSEQYYETAPALLVTVADDTDNSIVAGIASVTYQIDEKAAESVTINKDAMKTTVSFTIPSSKIPAGVTTISIVAKDNAGNESAETYTLKVKGPERKPEARIDYGKEKLTNLIANAEYRINDISYIADAQGCVPIGEAWMGMTLAIVKCGNGSETLDSDEQSVTIPARPRTPSPTALDETGPNRKDGRLIGLDVGAVYRVSTDNGATWKEMTTNTGGVLTGLSPGSYLVQKAATATGFASKPSTSLVKVEAYRISVVFMVDGGEYTTVYTTYGESITEIPKVPQKPDAGTQKYIGEWCDAQGNPVDFTNIKADMTVYAVHTKAYAVTLQQGAGYRLTASFGNAGYVKEGDNCGFTFTLSSGYRKKADFAVKINGVKVELTGGGSYTITDVREDKTVTVEGIEQIPSASGNQGSGGSHSSGNNGDDSNGGSDSPAGVSSSHGGNTSDNGNGMGTSKTTGGGNTTEGGRTETESSSSDRDGGTVRNGNQTGENAADRQGIPEGEEVLTVSASIENGRIIIPDNADVTVQAIPTGNAGGMANTSTILKLDDGAVVVTVICTEQECTAGVEDTVTVANAVLTQTHMELVSNGEIIEIRIDVKDISSQVPEQDKEIIESGIASYSEEIPDLTLGMYVDISMFVRAGQEDWQAVTQTAEPIAAVIGIPVKLREDSREYYIIRAHDGEYTLMEDMDDASDTITISTDRFSSYAIAWQETEDGGSRCRLCHICPTFLGICCFVWLAIAVAVILVVFVIMMRRRREEEGTEING